MNEHLAGRAIGAEAPSRYANALTTGREPTLLERAHAELQSSVAQLDDTVAILRDRLGGVLAPDNSPTEKLRTATDAPEPPHSQVFREVQEVVARVRRIDRNVHDIIQRLEV